MRTFLVDQTLDLVHPPLPLFIADEIIRPFKEVVGQDPKGMLSICTTSGLLSIDPGSKLVLNLRVTKTERNLLLDEGKIMSGLKMDTFGERAGTYQSFTENYNVYLLNMEIGFYHVYLWPLVTLI